MKLRLRDLTTKQTHKIQVPDSCTLHHLKHILSDSISVPSPSSLHLSLNREDELAGLGSDTLQSLAVTSGDLIFFSLDPNSFTLQTPIPQFGGSSSSNGGGTGSDSNSVVAIGEPGRDKTLTGEIGSSDLGETLIVQSDSEVQKIESLTKTEETLVVDQETIIINTQKDESNCENKVSEVSVYENLETDSNMEVCGTVQHGNPSGAHISEPDSKNEFAENQNLELGHDETKEEQGIMGESSVNMEIDGGDEVEDTSMGKGFSVPGFLRKVFDKELGFRDASDQKLIVIAVHAVLFESGFVGFDTFTRAKINGFYLPDMWPLSGFTISLCYTLPEIVQPSGMVETVAIKVQSLAKYLMFYGSVAGKKSGTYKIQLDKDRLAFVLNLMWAKVDASTDGSSVFNHEKEVFEFWKTVKDKLSLPLLIDLCEVANLPPPPCFSRLPTDLKLQILELIPGADLAKVACVSKELQFLSSYDDLWEKKFQEEFGDAEVAVAEISWSRKFVKAWEARKRRRVVVRMARVAPQVPPALHRRPYRDPYPFRFPGIIGGDYDLFPNIPMGFQFSRTQGGRNVMPRCNLGDRQA